MLAIASSSFSRQKGRFSVVKKMIELGISIKGYMIPEFTDNVYGKTAEMSKTITPSRVVFGYEGDATNAQIKK